MVLVIQTLCTQPLAAAVLAHPALIESMVQPLGQLAPVLVVLELLLQFQEQLPLTLVAVVVGCM